MLDGETAGPVGVITPQDHEARVMFANGAIRSGGGELPDFDLDLGAFCRGGGIEQVACGRLVQVLLPAGLADPGGHPLHHQRRQTLLERDGRGARGDLAVLADDARHRRLRLKSASQRPASGS